MSLLPDRVQGMLLAALMTATAGGPALAAGSAGDCDRLAASAVIAQPRPAIAACEAAAKESPAQPRYAYQLGRAYQAAGREAEAAAQFQRAADAKYPPAITALGLAFRDGAGVEKDSYTALTILKTAADLGEAEAMDALGGLFEADDGVEPDEKQAVHWYGQAAERGNAAAMSHLAFALVNLDDGTDHRAEAFEWHRKAADAGISASMVELGFAYEKGEGLPQNTAEAVKWYSRAADLGDPEGLNNIGAMYNQGTGVKQDYAKALHYYELAMQKNQTLAYLNAAYLYGEGQGVAMNGAKAADLLLVALKGGEQGALDELLEPSIDWPTAFYAAVQKGLKEAGFYSGAVTGKPNPALAAAARTAFDSDNAGD